MDMCGQARKFTRAIFGIASVCGALTTFGVLGTVDCAAAREVVAFPMDYPAGTIIIRQHERKLYVSEGNGMAVRYPVAIGRAGRAWLGETSVEGKYMQPDWAPPAVVLRDHPNLRLTRGGSPHNPMGAAAITLRLSEVAIHGTNASMRRSVGTAASYGCIRMYNEDVVDLFQRTNVGSTVIAVP
jgi:lipoprotein-anchoring transpeptidase ErfK/SrfK